ncbi:MAG TPA: hypothetical protein VLS89_17715, partial [Candidatus Nanopelagicales bacterium]|nr:hypothetical protein [Candidatus Nanopelagicales bacterium]
MAFKNIARYGYRQTVAGTWDLGGGTRLSFGISDDRAASFTMEIFGPTTAQMIRRQRAAQLVGLSLEGPSGDDAGANLRPQLSGRGAVVVLIANLITFAANMNQRKTYTRVRRMAFALGAPIYHDNNIYYERDRGWFQRMMQNRDGRGVHNLNWVAEHYFGVIDSGPYFIEDGGRKWWESGMIVIPQSQIYAYGSSATVPCDVLMRVRTDVGGSELYLEVTSTWNHAVTSTLSGVFHRAGDIIYNP